MEMILYSVNNRWHETVRCTVFLVAEVDDQKISPLIITYYPKFPRPLSLDLYLSVSFGVSVRKICKVISGDAVQV
jgi:hypothetical protein